MTKRFTDYLTLIGLTQTAFVNRVEYVLERAGEVCPERFTDILVEDLITEDGTRQYLHLIAFSKNYVVALTDFLTSEEISVYPLTPGLRVLHVETNHYEFVDARPESRLFVRFEMIAGAVDGQWSLQTTGSNCDHAWAIVKKHIWPRLAPSADA